MDRVNLFLIGINKAGTTWLYHVLNHHPHVFMAEAKELYFFGDSGRDEEKPDDLEEYHSHFPFDAPYRYFGDATVMYYREPETADAIQAYNPDAKILAIVRDPIQRLLSHYQYSKQLGAIDETVSLSQAVDDDVSRLRSDSHYEETLPAYSERFGWDQFKIVSLEAAREAPEDFWANLLNFLSLPDKPRLPDEDRPENPTGSFAFRKVYRTTVRPFRNFFPNFRWLLRSTWGRWAKCFLLGLLGTAEPKADVLSTEIEALLLEEFAPTYNYLRDLKIKSTPKYKNEGW